MLLDALNAAGGFEWIAEHRVGVTPEVAAVCPERKAPRNYSIDIACPGVMMAVEADGGSHRTADRRDSDRVKDERLRFLGWTVVRFQNEYILANPLAAALTVIRTIG